MAVDYKDYYKILGVNKNASQKNVQKAYHKLVRQYHPDVNPGDKDAEEKFKEINEANEVLAEQRRLFEAFAHSLGETSQTAAHVGGRASYG
jgi:DnaJ-class molecular chaperone